MKGCIVLPINDDTLEMTCNGQKVTIYDIKNKKNSQILDNFNKGTAPPAAMTAKSDGPESYDQKIARQRAAEKVRRGF